MLSDRTLTGHGLSSCDPTLGHGCLPIWVVQDLSIGMTDDRRHVMCLSTHDKTLQQRDEITLLDGHTPVHRTSQHASLSLSSPPRGRGPG